MVKKPFTSTEWLMSNKLLIKILIESCQVMLRRDTKQLQPPEATKTSEVLFAKRKCFFSKTFFFENFVAIYALFTKVYKVTSQFNIR